MSFLQITQSWPHLPVASTKQQKPELLPDLKTCNPDPCQLQGEITDKEQGAVVKSIKWLHNLCISGLLDSISRRREGKEGCYLHKTHDVPASCICLDLDGPCFLGVFQWVAGAGAIWDDFFTHLFGTAEAARENPEPPLFFSLPLPPYLCHYCSLFTHDHLGLSHTIVVSSGKSYPLCAG